MRNFAQDCKRPLVIISLCLFTQPSHAELTLNMTQASENGFDVINFQNTLQTATESQIQVLSDASNAFAEQYDLISLNAEQAQKACKDNQLMKLNQLADLKPCLKNLNICLKIKMNVR